MNTFRNILISLGLIVSMLGSLSAQTDLKLRPLGFLLGNYNVSVDQAISPQFSVEGSLLLYQQAFRFNLGDLDPIDSGFGLVGIGKFYFTQTEDAASDFYTGPYASYKSLNSSGGGNSQRGAFGWHLGYKALFSSRFIIETDMGVGRALFTQSSPDYDPWLGTNEMLTNLDAYVRFSIGYRIVE